MENYKLREHVFLKVNTRKSCKLPVRLDNNRIIWQNRPNTLLEIVCWQIGQGTCLGESHLVSEMAMFYQQGEVLGDHYFTGFFLCLEGLISHIFSS